MIIGWGRRRSDVRCRFGASSIKTSHESCKHHSSPHYVAHLSFRRQNEQYVHKKAVVPKICDLNFISKLRPDENERQSGIKDAEENRVGYSLRKNFARCIQCQPNIYYVYNCENRCWSREKCAINFVLSS